MYLKQTPLMHSDGLFCFLNVNMTRVKASEVSTQVQSQIPFLFKILIFCAPWIFCTNNEVFKYSIKTLTWSTGVVPPPYILHLRPYHALVLAQLVMNH